MSTFQFDKLLSPRSVVVVGASPRATSPGRAVLYNLRRGGFPGTISLVNPRYDLIEGIHAVKSYRDLPGVPDLAVIAVSPAAVPSVIIEARARGTPAAIIVTAGLGHGPGSLAEQCETIARAANMRLVGPNCLGVLLPHRQLNASFVASMPQPGDLALISQSGAIAAGLAEWAATHDVGFSAVISLGDAVDVDFSDLLDYFAFDRRTRTIVLYIELIKDLRKFMSAARAAARAKPVLVLKSGRNLLGAKAALTHTGALAGSDAVYDAAFRRAGLLRVLDLEELFAAAQTLRHSTQRSGKKLAILTNGGGLGVLAVDRLADLGGELAAISPAAMQKLDSVLPPIWSRANPIDIAGDADEARYGAALQQLLADQANDAVLVMNVPTALASPLRAAERVVEVTEQHCKRVQPKPVFAAWIGSEGAVDQTFDAAKIPNYATEADAVAGFMHLVRYHDSREFLMTTPPNVPEHFAADTSAARQAIEAALRESRTWLDPLETTRVFAAYGIPLTPAALAADADEAVRLAKPCLDRGTPVVLKIQSPDIVHKSEVEGVRLNLGSERAVHEAAADILRRVRRAKPQARISGVTVFPMIVRPKARELIAGIADDPTFGPVVVFGQGGMAVEVINDKSLALPPLDLGLARAQIARTRVSRMLKAYRNVPAADARAIELLLLKLAQLAADIPAIHEVDINPILADHTGIIAVDARVSIAPIGRALQPHRHRRFAIKPYPKEWERHAKLNDGRVVLIRPVRPEDEELYRRFLAEVTQEDLRLRFFAPVKEFNHPFIARLTQIDYARAMAFIAIEESSAEMLGGVRLHANADYDKGEYAILVRSDLKGHGLGWLLMQLLIEYARAEGIHTIEGQVLCENTTMLTMCRELGFAINRDPEDPAVCDAKLSLF